MRPYLTLPSAYTTPSHPAPTDLVLSGNEGLTPPDGLDTQVAPQRLRQYPRTDALQAIFAATWGASTEQVLVTAGADDALCRAFRAVLGPGRNVVLPSPTFSMLPRFAAWVDAELRTVPWVQDWPVDAILAQVDANTAAIAVVSPNNPTGAVVTAEQLRAVSKSAPNALIMVDAAYAEFADEDLTQTALELPNAVVFRTLSKAWGLAGARLGYAVGPAQVIGWMRACGLPYPCSASTLAIAERWVEQGGTAVDTYVATVRAQRAELTQLLTNLGARPQPSQANFVLARFVDAAWVYDALAGLGIAVRTFAEPALADALRITIPGTEAAFERLCNGLRAAMAPQAVLFDLDGVLADVTDSYRTAIVRTAAHFGLDVDLDAIEAAKQSGDANNDWVLAQRLLAASGIDIPLDQVTAVFEDAYQGGLWRSETLLDYVFPDLPIGIVTGRPRADAERFLRTFDLSSDALVTMEDAPAKPSPEPVQLALAGLGVTRAWMLGDTPDDIRAARAAGVVPIGVLAPGQSDPSALFAAGAARVFCSAAELASLLERPCAA